MNELVIVTTMLDAEEYTKEELADLFIQRWNIELDLRSIWDLAFWDDPRRIIGASRKLLFGNTFRSAWSRLHRNMP